MGSIIAVIARAVVEAWPFDGSGTEDMTELLVILRGPEDDAN